MDVIPLSQHIINLHKLQLFSNMSRQFDKKYFIYKSEWLLNSETFLDKLQLFSNMSRQFDKKYFIYKSEWLLNSETFLDMVSRCQS
jgi:hypothetical protein